MTAPNIYLDYNATAPLLPAAQEAISSLLAMPGNPSAVHWSGRNARKTVEAARADVADLVDGPAADVVFTSGASEANVLALRGLPAKRRLVSAIEHDSVLNADAAAIQIPVTEAGLVDCDALAKIVVDGDLVSVMAVNNETGVIQPLDHLADIVKHAGALLHIDAVQAIGRIPFSFRTLKPAALSISAHKLGGPPGVGALIVDSSVSIVAQTRGGGQERGRRGGTENVLGIAGFGAAACHVAAHWERDVARLSSLRDRLEAGITESVSDAIVVGANAPRVANTSCIALPGFTSERQVIAMDLARVAVSAGSACSSGKVKQSHVLAAMGMPETLAGASLRFSLGWATSEAEIDAAIVAYGKMARKNASASVL